MARNKKEFGGSRYFVLGAIWWFVVSGTTGVLHLIFPGLVETPLVVVLAVVIALVGTGLILYIARPK